MFIGVPEEETKEVETKFFNAVKKNILTQAAQQCQARLKQRKAHLGIITPPKPRGNLASSQMTGHIRWANDEMCVHARAHTLRNSWLHVENTGSQQTTKYLHATFFKSKHGGTSKMFKSNYLMIQQVRFWLCTQKD